MWANSESFCKRSFSISYKVRSNYTQLYVESIKMKKKIKDRLYFHRMQKYSNRPLNRNIILESQKDTLNVLNSSSLVSASS